MSRAGQRKESRAHQFRGGRAGGFGEGGRDRPPKGGPCVLWVDPYFVYDWDTGGEITGVAQLFAFNKDLQQIARNTEKVFNDDGSWRFAAQGNCNFDGSEGGRYFMLGVAVVNQRARNVIHAYDNRVQRVQRVILPDEFQDEGGEYDLVEFTSFCAAAVEGSIRELICTIRRRYRVDRRYRYDIGVARLSNTFSLVDVVTTIDDPPTPYIWFGEPGWVFDGTDRAMREVLRNPFRFGDRKQLTNDFIVPDWFLQSITDAGYDSAIALIPFNSQVTGGGFWNLYTPFGFHKANHFPAYRVGVVRVFVDHTGEFTGIPGAQMYTDWGVTDVGWHGPHEQAVSIKSGGD